MKTSRILVALDASPRHAEVLRAAVDLARPAGGKLLLFRAVGLQPDVPAGIYASPTDVGAALVEIERNALRDIAQKLPPELVEGTFVEVGVPWQAICREATEKDVDLLVLGSHGYNMIDRILGTTAAKVVNHADRDVLVVRTHDDAPAKKRRT